ncbi:DNA-processing protein DprA [Geothermobacter ehrlichii]|nr:DNA-processing protein DprA [Geothermobacter ehrlichii]
MKRAWLRLHLTPGLGRKSIFRLIETYGSPEDALQAPAADWCQRCGIRADVAAGRPANDDSRLEKILERLEQLQVDLLTYWDDHNYPPLLRQIPDPPALLYLRGRLPDQEMFAIVGSRRASARGLAFTEEIAGELAACGICIVSGLARGIDTAAHRGALATGTTVAVLGCGIDRVYPPENTRLFHQIESRGALLSEYAPGTPPLAGHFPGRNRLISGLARGVLIVEAAKGSGSLHTAEFALETGREVFAVPNPVGQATGDGVNQLLKDGARVVTESRDILEVLWRGRLAGRQVQTGETATANLSEQERNMLKLLSFDPVHGDEIIRKSGLTPPEVSDILLHLELAGLVVQQPGGYYVRSC